MSLLKEQVNLKIPGKVVINGSYIVLEGEMASVVVLNKYINVTINTQNSDKFDLNLNIENGDMYLHSENDKGHWIYELITTALTFINVENYNVNINGYFDDFFFLENGVKTGLGSSSCIFIAVIYSLYKIGKMKKPLLIAPKVDFKHNKELVNLLYTVSKTLYPSASGCDIMASFLGPINFSFNVIQKINLIARHIILGSFGSSTSTRKMLDLVGKVNWTSLKTINKILVKNLRNKETYKKYLEEIRHCSNIIMPDRQYKILKKTFELNILGCGISGAGGEDAVWCITDNVGQVKYLWEQEFTYVCSCEVVNNGIIIN